MSGEFANAERVARVEYLPDVSARASTSGVSHEFYRVYYRDGSVAIECLTCGQSMRDRWS